MMTDDELLTRAYSDIEDYLIDTEQEREEARRAYAYVHGHQYDERVMGDRLSQREKDGFFSIDLSSPIIKAISGGEMMNDTSIDVVSISSQYDDSAEKQNKWIHAGNRLGRWDDNKSKAIFDCLIAGVGAIANANEYDNIDYPVGKPDCDHAPYFLMFYDRSVMGSDINKNAQYVGYFDIVRDIEMTRYIKSKIGNKKTNGSASSSFDTSRVLGFNRKNREQLELLTHYYYYEFEDFYDVVNPLLIKDVNDILQQDDTFAQVLSDALRAAELSPDVDVWSLTKKQYDMVNDAMSAGFIQLGISFDGLRYSKRPVKTYYYAQIARGQVLVHERSFRQNGHMMVFWQAEYDDFTNSYYGLMRKLSGVQDVINLTVNQVVGYTSADMRGGRVHLKGDPQVAQKYIQNNVENEDVSYLGTENKSLEVIPKNKADSLQNSLNLFDIMTKILPRTLGLDEMALFGVIESGDMTSDLFGKAVKQSRAVLQFIMQSNGTAVVNQAHCMLALGRAITKPRKDDVVTIRDIKGGDYAVITYHSLMQPYDIEIVEREMTADEKQAAFLMLKDFVAGLPPEAQQAAIPTLLKYSRIDAEGKEALTQALTPQPPQPNPLNDEMLKSQIALQYAQAEKLSADAKEKQSTIQLAPEKMQSEIDKNNAQAAKNIYG